MDRASLPEDDTNESPDRECLRAGLTQLAKLKLDPGALRV